MNTLDVVLAVEEWATTVIPELSSYPSPPEEIAKALPLVIGEVTTDKVQDGEQQLPGMAQYQQTFIRSWTINLLILSDPEPGWTSSHPLYGYADAIGAALRQEVVLNDNVVIAQYYEASYEPPEVRTNDGTVARQVTIQIVVGEMIGV